MSPRKAGPGREHGTHACFVWGPEPGPGKGCRCEPCRAANTAYERERSRWVLPPYVGADDVRRHLAWLGEQGIGLKTVAKRAGVSHGSLSKIVYGDRTRGRGPSKRVRRETRDAILAVSPADAADGAKVPAGPTWEAVNELLRRGWTKVAIARAIGQQGPGLQLGRSQVHARHARTIKGLLDQPVPERRGHGGPKITLPEPVEAEPARDDIDLFLIEMAESLEARVDGRQWRARAACNRPGVETWVFFPTRGDTRTIAAAKAICATCPVQEPCLAESLRYANEPGIRAGTTARERRALRREVAA